MVGYPILLHSHVVCAGAWLEAGRGRGKGKVEQLVPVHPDENFSQEISWNKDGAHLKYIHKISTYYMQKTISWIYCTERDGGNGFSRITIYEDKQLPYMLENLNKQNLVYEK